MKIVNTDNFGSDYPNEKFLGFIDSKGNARPMALTDKDFAIEIVQVLNSRIRGDSKRYWKLVGDDYALQPEFEP